jgi:hypothetical protein
MNCPDCNGAMWDNRETKRKPTQPDYKCKDKDGCGKGVWLDKKTSGAGTPSGNGHTPNPSAGRALGPVYNECLVFAKAAIQHHFGKDVATSDIIAGTATLFIQAAKTGQPIRVMKPLPPPPPPPPPPAPVNFDDYPGALEDTDDLPF